MRCVGVGEQLERQTIATIGTGVKDNPGLKHRVEQFRVQWSVFGVGGKPVRRCLLFPVKEVNGLHAITAEGFDYRCPTAVDKGHLPRTTPDCPAFDEGVWLVGPEGAQGEREDRNSATPPQLQRYRAL